MPKNCPYQDTENPKICCVTGRPCYRIPVRCQRMYNDYQAFAMSMRLKHIGIPDLNIRYAFVERQLKGAVWTP